MSLHHLTLHLGGAREIESGPMVLRSRDRWSLLGTSLDRRRLIVPVPPDQQRGGFPPGEPWFATPPLPGWGSELIEKVWLGGAPGQIRTADLLVRSQTLYPTELRARRINYNKRPRGIRIFDLANFRRCAPAGPAATCGRATLPCCQKDPPPRPRRPTSRAPG